MTFLAPESHHELLLEDDQLVRGAVLQVAPSKGRCSSCPWPALDEPKWVPNLPALRETRLLSLWWHHGLLQTLSRKVGAGFWS